MLLQIVQIICSQNIWSGTLFNKFKKIETENKVKKQKLVKKPQNQRQRLYLSILRCSIYLYDSIYIIYDVLLIYMIAYILYSIAQADFKFNNSQL